MAPEIEYLSPREQQIMEIVYRRGRVSATDVMADMPDPLANSSVRTFLRILEEKGHLLHVVEKGRFFYMPTRLRQSAARAAMKRVLATYFGGSVEQAVAMLLTEKEAQLTPDELDSLQRIIKEAREKEGEAL